MKKIRALLNIEFLIQNDALKNWRMILFLSLLALIMIASGHQADQKIFKIAALNSEIKALKSDFIEVKKQLLILKKETHLIRALAPQGLGPATSPPLKIIVVNE